MKPVRLGSSAVDAIRYDEDRKTLDVEFRGGGRYRYLKIPLSIYQGLLKAELAGAYWNAIKDQFEYVKLD